jgi:hypothetical protein
MVLQLMHQLVRNHDVLTIEEYQKYLPSDSVPAD